VLDATAQRGAHNATLDWLSARRQILAWWAASRALVFATALALELAGRHYGLLGPKIFHRPLGLLGAWDGQWYVEVATKGYLLVPGRQSDPAFFPLYPIALKLLGATGMPAFAAGILISNGAFLAALLALDAVGRAHLPAADARRAAVFAAVFPLGYVFSMVYPESLLLALGLLAVLAAQRDRWFLAALLVAFATLARPEGVFFALPIAQIAFERRALHGRALAAIVAAPTALLSFPLYLGWALGDPHAWAKAESAWGRSFRLDGAVTGWHELLALRAGHGWLLRDAVFLVLYAGLIAVARRARIPWGWILASAAVLLLPLESGSVESVARFGLVLPPVYWGLAVLGRRRAVTTMLLALSAVLLAAGTATLPLAFP
jgi:hypothetical protein